MQPFNSLVCLLEQTESMFSRYYTAAGATPMKQLLNDALIKARDHKFDVFNALDILENTRELLVDLKFGIGDGNLHYYLFNWRMHQQLQPRDVGLILM